MFTISDAGSDLVQTDSSFGTRFDANRSFQGRGTIANIHSVMNADVLEIDAPRAKGIEEQRSHSITKPTLRD